MTGLLYWGYDHLGSAASPALLGFFLYMVAFMDTVATIPTGSMAERWKWKSFVIWGLFCGALYYPLFAAWTWGGGWLAKSWDTMSLGAGYVDFAGSGVVHAVGGVAALAGAIVLGPRIGKFGPDGKPKAIPGHNIPMAHARLLHPAVRLVRLQRRIDLRRHRHPVRHGCRQHGDRRRRRCRRRDVLHHVQGGQARPRHDGERHARRPGGHHGTVRLRVAVGCGGHRCRCCGARHRSRLLHRAARHRRSGGRHRGARRVRHVRCARRRPVRQRCVRRWLERCRRRRRRGDRR